MESVPMKSSRFLALVACAAAVSHAQVSFAPVTAGATGGAQKLYNFLATHYGVKTVSGMMSGDVSGSDVKQLVDVDSMYLRTGKYPALVGFDYLFATGVKASDSWYKGYTSSTLVLAKDLWAKGGIPAFTWHWKDPSDSVDAFYTKGTTFDFTKGFQAGTTTWDTTSATYKQLVSDIDEISANFLVLQKDSVAAVFRPIHEASGAWFWWGTKGGAAFQALYNLIYDRMVATNGVKNLVWVWNPQFASDISWNPGATKYDVISLDIYEGWDYTSKFVSGYNTLKTNFGSLNKIFAVSENGSIPDISTMKTNNTVWSWWMPWYQSWGGKFLDQTVDAVWKANMDDPCTITLDEMPGWGAYTLSNAKAAACTNAYTLGKLDTARPVVETVPGDTATNGWLRVKFSTPSGDTAKGNIIIDSAKTSTGTAKNLSTAKTLTLNVVNGNTMQGFWFTVAFLGNQTAGWSWAQPEGCWVNPGDSVTCTIDLTTTAKDQKVLTGADYTTFMSNIFKIYIENFGENFSGSVYFDDVVVDGSIVINKFDKPRLYNAESAKNLVVADVVGHGSTAGIAPRVKASSDRITLVGEAVQLSVARSGSATVELFDLQGRLAATLHRGDLAAGTHDFSVKNLQGGLYVVRAQGTHLDATGMMLLK
jgi:hypothetical protein